MAQVYSVNVVGYVNQTVPAGKLAILANPLNNGDNNCNTIMPLPDTADGATIFRFDADLQVYKDSITFIGGFGWFSPTDNAPTIAPGEGFFMLAPSSTALNLTFVGEVIQGPSTVAIKGLGKLSLVGSTVPQQNNLGDPAQAATMGFPAKDGDTIFLWDDLGQTYKNSYGYIDGYGWFSADDPSPAGPLIDVAKGFWVQKGASNPDENWSRTFNVGP
jgi:hypothetical protein